MTARAMRIQTPETIAAERDRIVELIIERSRARDRMRATGGNPAAIDKELEELRRQEADLESAFRGASELRVEASVRTRVDKTGKARGEAIKALADVSVLGGQIQQTVLVLAERVALFRVAEGAMRRAAFYAIGADGRDALPVILMDQEIRALLDGVTDGRLRAEAAIAEKVNSRIAQALRMLQRAVQVEAEEAVPIQ